jgi:hypothetical protein
VVVLVWVVVLFWLVSFGMIHHVGRAIWDASTAFGVVHQSFSVGVWLVCIQRLKPHAFLSCLCLGGPKFVSGLLVSPVILRAHKCMDVGSKLSSECCRYRCV